VVLPEPAGAEIHVTGASPHSSKRRKILSRCRRPEVFGWVILAMGGALLGFEPAERRRSGFGTPFSRVVVCGFLFFGISVPLAWGGQLYDAGDEKTD